MGGIRYRLILFLFVTPLILCQCKSTATGDNLLLENGASEFVRIDPARPTELTYKSKPYRFSSTNSYSMLNSKSSADKQFALMEEMGLNALRMWGFWNGGPDSLQPSYGSYNEDKWKLFDYVVATAGKKGIKLIITLSNYWFDYGGIELLNKWLGFPDEVAKYKDREIFFKDMRTKILYAKYVEDVLNRKNTITGVLYKDDPAIMMWEPINEIRGRTDPSGQLAVDWMTWAAQLIKKSDPHHLISDGAEGLLMNHPAHRNYPWQTKNPLPSTLPDGSSVSNVSEGAYFETLCPIPAIDVCSIHAWPGNWFMSYADKPDEFVEQWIEEHIAYMKKNKGFQKPLFVGEFGWQIVRNRGAKAQEERKQVFEKAYFRTAKNQRKIREEVSGIGFWNITGGGIDQNVLTFDVICPDDKEVCPLIKEFSKAQLQ